MIVILITNIIAVTFEKLFMGEITSPGEKKRGFYLCTRLIRFAGLYPFGVMFALEIIYFNMAATKRNSSELYL